MPLLPKLKAAPDVVIVDVEAGQKYGTTQIEYSKEADQAIWHRWRPGAWLRVTLQVTAPDDPALNHGFFSSPKLEPGTVYVVAVWSRDVDPNRLPLMDVAPRALASLTVFSLLKRPDRRSFFSDENQRTGGTYREHQVAATSPVNAYMTVSTGKPIAGTNGFRTFAQVEAAAFASVAQSFLLQITDLLPGKHYYELFRMSDQFGNWEFLEREFTTLQRRIRFEPTDLFVDDDSDDYSNGEGWFRFLLIAYNVVSGGYTILGQLSYSNGNLETGKSTTPAPSGQILVGPAPVNEDSRDLQVSVQGGEDDSGSFPADGDDVATGTKDLFLPKGTVDEVVSQRTDTVVADSNDSLRFRLSFKYWVEYF